MNSAGNVWKLRGWLLKLLRPNSRLLHSLATQSALLVLVAHAKKDRIELAVRVTSGVGVMCAVFRQRGNMLKKELTIPGARLKVRDEIKDGLIGSMASDAPALTHLPLMTQPWVGPGSNQIGAVPGDILTVVTGPQKKKAYANNNCAQVHRMGDPAIYYVFWCTLRASCDHV